MEPVVIRYRRPLRIGAAVFILSLWAGTAVHQLFPGLPWFPVPAMGLLILGICAIAGSRSVTVSPEGITLRLGFRQRAVSWAVVQQAGAAIVCEWKRSGALILLTLRGGRPKDPGMSCAAWEKANGRLAIALPYSSALHDMVLHCRGGLDFEVSPPRPAVLPRQPAGLGAMAFSGACTLIWVLMAANGEYFPGVSLALCIIGILPLFDSINNPTINMICADGFYHKGARRRPWSHVIQAGILLTEELEPREEIAITFQGGRPCENPKDPRGWYTNNRHGERILRWPYSPEVHEMILRYYGPLDFHVTKRK